jgi:hypothetical protein
MVQRDRRLRHRAPVWLVLWLVLPGSLSVSHGAREYFPLAPGNYWIYRGTIREPGDAGEEAVECELDLRVLVTDVRRWEDDVYVAMLQKTSTPLAIRHRTEAVQPSSEVFAYFVDHGTVYEIHGDSVDLLIGNEYRDEMSLEDIRESVTDRTPAFVFPLTDGQRFSGPDGAVRTDDDYKWVVTKGDAITLLGKLHEDVYVLCYRDLSGGSEVHFVPGLGIVRDKYGHHGTITEWDLRLSDYHLEDPAPTKGEPDSPADH